MTVSVGRYVGELIAFSREATGNRDFAEDSSGIATEGISDNLLLEFMWRAQQFVQARIHSVYDSAFVEEYVITLVNATEGYTIPDNVFLDNKIVSIELSESGNLEDYYPLPPAGFAQRDTRPGIPYQYIRKGNYLLFNQIPNRSGMKARVMYHRSLDRLDIRRGLVDTHNTTSITVTNANALLTRANYVSTVSPAGTVKDRNILVSSYSSGVITIPTTTLTVTDDTDYVIIGKYVGSHAYPWIERYLQAAAEFKLQWIDSSIDMFVSRDEAKEILADVVDSYAAMIDDVQGVPVVDSALS